MQKTLDDSLVNSLDSDLVGSLGDGLITDDQSGIKLLQVGLQLGLIGLVVLVSNLGRNDIAIQALDAAIKLTPGNPALLRDMGLVYKRMGNKEEAKKYLYSISTRKRVYHWINSIVSSRI